MTDIFPISFLISLLFIFFDKFLSKLGYKNLRDSPQTLHFTSVSRFGGIAIYTSLLIVCLYTSNDAYDFLRNLLLCSIPLFFVGLLDDFRVNISPIFRMVLGIPTAILCYIFLGTEAYSLEIYLIDELFEYKFFSLLFICFALIGMANAFNVIDGMNGLALLYSISVCATILFSFELSKTIEIYYALVALLFSLLGIFVLNFPFGKIFLGDGGAYMLGLMLSVCVIKVYQINQVSPWYVLLVFIYPTTEILSSIFRRIIARISTTQPDNNHLHHLIYKRIKKIGIQSERIKHAIVTVLLFMLYFPFLLGANYFSNDSFALKVSCLIFVVLYFIFYLLLSPQNFRIKQ